MVEQEVNKNRGRYEVENNFRKFLTMILAMTLIITVMPFNAYADTEAGEFSYTEIITPTYEDGRTFQKG